MDFAFLYFIFCLCILLQHIFIASISKVVPLEPLLALLGLLHRCEIQIERLVCFTEYGIHSIVHRCYHGGMTCVFLGGVRPKLGATSSPHPAPRLFNGSVRPEGGVAKARQPNNI